MPGGFHFGGRRAFLLALSAAEKPIEINPVTLRYP